MFMEYGVIMAGGSGTRLWPLSRGTLPKQLLKVVQGKSLLQLSYDRLRGEAISDVPGAYRVRAFKEKPDKATADRYVESGHYYWNSGMFVWRADTVLGEIQAHLSSSYKGLMQIGEAWGTPNQDKVL